jgi:hypothetical protein
MTSRRSSVETQKQRQATEKKLRTGGRNCPVCLELLPSLGGRAARACSACGGRPVPDRQCAKCHSATLWEGSVNAGCSACGHHGSKVKVFAGQGWLKE